MRRRRVVLAGGGTGGHVLPLVAIADALVASGLSADQLELVASERGPDRSILEGRGYPATYLPGRGIQRSLSLSAVRDNVVAVVNLLRALGSTVVAMGRWDPAVVVSGGGYAAFAAVAAAVLRRRPLVVVNVDAVPGLVHRLFGRFAVASCVGFSTTGLPHQVVTGVPVSAKVANVRRDPASRAAAKAALGVGDRPLLGVVGGSLGARSLNRAAFDLAPKLEVMGIELYHVAGRRDIDHLLEANAARGETPGYHLVAFEQRMELLYAGCDLVCARAGGSTVAELEVAGVPSILVPLPGAPGDHQTHNATAMVELGASVLIPDAELSADRLEATVVELLGAPGRLDAMGQAARSTAPTDAARAIAEVVRSHGA